ncbi:MAG TPA: glycosyltransferase [Myxococcales bacterium LLY-WYZ-16_1]|nr:glycosyltransferase [Myxococcales bacterium LLY-WYZ-16_1]
MRRGMSARLPARPGLRIGFVLPGLGVGGAERIVTHLALDLAARGHACWVAATTRGGLRARELQRHGVPVEVLGLNDPSRGLRAAGRLRQWMADHRLDVVHSHLSPADILTAWARASLRPRPRWVATLHNPGVELSRRRWAVWAASLRLGAWVTAVGDAVARAAPVPVARVIRPSSFDPTAVAPSRLQARRALKLRSTRPWILFVGRLAVVKGVDRIEKLAARVPGASFAVVGDGPEGPALARAGVHAWGSRAAPERLLPAANLLLLPSRSEGFPQILLEAAAARVPVVATATAGTCEILTPDTGYLTPLGPEPQVLSGLERAIRTALADPVDARARADRARARVLAEGWTRRAMVDRFERLFRDGV